MSEGRQFVFVDKILKLEINKSGGPWLVTATTTTVMIMRIMQQQLVNEWDDKSVKIKNIMKNSTEESEAVR